MHVVAGSGPFCVSRSTSVKGRVTLVIMPILLILRSRKSAVSGYLLDHQIRESPNEPRLSLYRLLPVTGEQRRLGWEVAKRHALGVSTSAAVAPQAGSLPHHPCSVKEAATPSMPTAAYTDEDTFVHQRLASSSVPSLTLSLPLSQPLPLPFCRSLLSSPFSHQNAHRLP